VNVEALEAGEKGSDEEQAENRQTSRAKKGTKAKRAA